jgi:NAD(P)H-hydrate repair Nnr-like enzyme with NAD(P)H-hydrate dehydratase domain
MTPHHGELAYLTGQSTAVIADDPVVAALSVAREFSAVVALKGVRTIVTSANGPAYVFEGGSSGLATSGSGDVLAGIIGGLAARGANALTAAGWGVHVHGAAGEKLSAENAPIGFLARDLLALIPGLFELSENG